MFVKGKEKTGGRAKGVGNKEDKNSLRILLQGCFHENRLIIRNTLNSLCADVETQVKQLNAKVIESTDVSVIRAYASIRESLLSDFKWLMSLKASMEPRQAEISGRDGDPLQIKPPQILIIKHESAGKEPKQEPVQVNRIPQGAN